MSDQHDHAAYDEATDAEDSVDLSPDEPERDAVEVDAVEVDVVEVDVVEVDVVAVEVLEVEADEAYAARAAFEADAAVEAEAQEDALDDGPASEDERLDEALDDLDEGDAAVRAGEQSGREGHLPSGPGELPLLIAARERFSSLDDVPVTGDARVDAATARLDELPDLPTADHVAVYDDVHQRLQDALADADPR